MVVSPKEKVEAANKRMAEAKVEQKVEEVPVVQEVQEPEQPKQRNVFQEMLAYIQQVGYDGKKILAWIDQNGKDEAERRALHGFYVDQYNHATFNAILGEVQHAHLSELIILKMQIEKLIRKYEEAGV